jgi:hypothetical protein
MPAAYSIRQVRVLIGYVMLMSSGVRGYRHDQVGVEGCGDPLEQGDGGDDTACGPGVNGRESLWRGPAGPGPAGYWAGDGR